MKYLQENGGISGIILFKSSIKKMKIGSFIYYTLYALQHRGQSSIGIFIKNNNYFLIKKKGIVSSLIMNKVKNIDGFLAIGNIGDKNILKINSYQPFILSSNDNQICISYVGKISNRDFLIKKITQNGFNKNISDHELICKLLLNELLKKNEIDSIVSVLKDIIGSYCMILSINNKLYAIRDPYGVRPLCFGKINNDGYIIASESSAIDIINGIYINDIKPGEIVEFDENNNIKHYTFIQKKKRYYCVFEYIYLARPDSIINSRLVYTIRENFGKQLAKENKINCDIICPIPDSGIISAIGYSEESKIKYTESIVKNKYVGRTFILSSKKDRDSTLMLKMNIIKENFFKKKVMIIDDSIVRGTTIKKIIPMIKKLNPKEIHIGITSPEIINSCCFGVNIKNKKELVSQLLSKKEL